MAEKIMCQKCGKEFNVFSKIIKKARNYFCSDKCYKEYNDFIVKNNTI